MERGCTLPEIGRNKNHVGGYTFISLMWVLQNIYYHMSYHTKPRFTLQQAPSNLPTSTHATDHQEPPSPPVSITTPYKATATTKITPQVSNQPPHHHPQPGTQQTPIHSPSPSILPNPSAAGTTTHDIVRPRRRPFSRQPSLKRVARQRCHGDTARAPTRHPLQTASER